MMHARKIWATLALATTTAAGALLGAGGPAHADPPAGWEPGQYGVEYDFGDLGWVHHGHYVHTAGNWHTGWLNVEEDDDGLTGGLLDWQCPHDAVPPGPYDDVTGTPCVLIGSRDIEENAVTDVAVFHQKTNRLTVHGDFPIFDSSTGAESTTRIDLSIRARGAATVEDDESGTILDYSETYLKVHGRGHVDGHRVSGRHTHQVDNGRVGFWLDGWTRTS